MKETIHVNQSVIASVILMVALFISPLAVVVQRQAELHTGSENGDAAEISVTKSPQGEEDRGIILRVLRDGQVMEMDMASYLIGVVQAEMPASFEEESLKAQAVAARTYTLYKLHTGGNHGEQADICTDFACCQAYLDADTARKNWGDSAEVYAEKIRRAVEETDGQVLLYGGAPILAVFHSSSAGLTRPAGEVWSGDVPYLQAVVSPEQAEGIPNYHSRVEVSVEVFQQTVRERYPEASFSGDAGGWITDCETDDAGNVVRVTVGGVTMRGSELRGLLGLRSACFTWEIQGNKIVFFVTGYGHGVGLSQYGANQMAKDGAGWEEILSHYYTGATIGSYRFTKQQQA